MLVALVTLKVVAAMPLKVTLVAPPKPVPVRVTVVPTGALGGATRVMVGTGVVTVNGTPLLNTPPLNTTTLPLVAPFGTMARMF